ncbi:hypothetical protein WISP_103562 [Willisornis vidua]|uniref:Uncharacterized protein n=1 Tax=Willisornis vidua TaxID=1566151 RepID=A0ABQ9CYT1_9PASS|nr:hypothetical protein WISP_103562 [Willisornis vidua]
MFVASDAASTCGVKILAERGDLNPFLTQPALTVRIVSIHEVHLGTPLKSVKVPLNGIPSLKQANHTTQFGVICTLPEGALNPPIIDEDIK